MARPLRIEYNGALYHITARGNERNPIYREEGDCQKFLDILAELPQRSSVLIHGYVLMGNHYHLLIETPKGNITKVMHYLNATYSGYFNKKYGRVGHLFQGRYKGLLIEKERYLLSVSRYIHLNPVRAGISRRPEEYKWSSYRAYGKGKKDKIITISPEYEGLSDSNIGRTKKYEEYVSERGKDSRRLGRYFKTGVCGSSSFTEKLRRNGLIPVWSHSGRPGKKCSAVEY